MPLYFQPFLYVERNLEFLKIGIWVAMWPLYTLATMVQLFLFVHFLGFEDEKRFKDVEICFKRVNICLTDDSPPISWSRFWPIRRWWVPRKKTMPTQGNVAQFAKMSHKLFICIRGWGKMEEHHHFIPFLCWHVFCSGLRKDKRPTILEQHLLHPHPHPCPEPMFCFFE